MASRSVNEIVCRACGRKISNELIDSAESGEGSGSDFFICECGERITFWAATGQLRDQKKLGVRFKNWLRSLFGGKD